MRCSEIMKKNVECLSPEDTAQVAARRMRDNNVGFLPVCDAEKRVLGTVTDRDLAVRLLAEGRAAMTPVNEVMTRQVISCQADDDLGRAHDLMTEHRKSRVVCVDGRGRLIGVISLSDIAQRDDARRAGQTLRGVTQREART